MQNVGHGPYLCPTHTKCHSCGSSVPGNGLSVRCEFSELFELFFDLGNPSIICFVLDGLYFILSCHLIVILNHGIFELLIILSSCFLVLLCTGTSIIWFLA